MKKVWPAAQRNAAHILEILERVLPTPGLTLEIASGTGQHAAHFAQAMPSIRWQPTEYDQTSLPSIDAWREESGLENFLPAAHLDVMSDVWPVSAADSVFCANMIHIAPWACCLGLFEGAGRVTSDGGLLVLYGPFLESDVETTESNLGFDASLRSRNPEWGIRHLDEVEAVANRAGFVLEERVSMPANNLCLMFRRTA